MESNELIGLTVSSNWVWALAKNKCAEIGIGNESRELYISTRASAGDAIGR